MLDFHVHTKMSDGQYYPAEIIKKAANLGFSVVAITDHDTISGLDEAEKAVAALNQDGIQLKLVRGVELNINWKTSGEFHLLGLGLQKISGRFFDVMENLQKSRDERNAEIVKKMNGTGIEISMQEINGKFPEGMIGRPHFAQMLVEKKIARNTNAAFKNFLSRGRPFYVEHVGANLDEAITAIVESGGAPVIAHPLSLYKSWGKIDEIFKDIFERGVAGLEAYHPGATPHDCRRLEELAKKRGFFVTAGSDFHGEKIRADRKLGYTAGDKVIDDRFWTEELRPYLIKNSETKI